MNDRRAGSRPASPDPERDGVALAAALAGAGADAVPAEIAALRAAVDQEKAQLFARFDEDGTDPAVSIWRSAHKSEWHCTLDGIERTARIIARHRIVFAKATLHRLEDQLGAAEHLWNAQRLAAWVNDGGALYFRKSVVDGWSGPLSPSALDGCEFLAAKTGIKLRLGGKEIIDDCRIVLPAAAPVLQGAEGAAAAPAVLCEAWLRRLAQSGELGTAPRAAWLAQSHAEPGMAQLSAKAFDLAWRSVARDHPVIARPGRPRRAQG